MDSSLDAKLVILQSLSSSWSYLPSAPPALHLPGKHQSCWLFPVPNVLHLGTDPCVCYRSYVLYMDARRDGLNACIRNAAKKEPRGSGHKLPHGGLRTRECHNPLGTLRSYLRVARRALLPVDRTVRIQTRTEKGPFVDCFPWFELGGVGPGRLCRDLRACLVS